MKRLFLSAFLFSLIMVSSKVYAHPPSEIKAAYDTKTKTLTATIFHPVSNPQTHFINKVEIFLNGQVVIEQKISRQENNAQLNVVYAIPDATVGSVVTVEAYCNINGKLKQEIKIKQ